LSDPGGVTEAKAYGLSDSVGHDGEAASRKRPVECCRMRAIPQRRAGAAAAAFCASAGCLLSRCDERRARRQRGHQTRRPHAVVMEREVGRGSRRHGSRDRLARFLLWRLEWQTKALFSAF
jgi:hypothetical protein